MGESNLPNELLQYIYSLEDRVNKLRIENDKLLILIKDSYVEGWLDGANRIMYSDFPIKEGLKSGVISLCWSNSEVKKQLEW